LTLSHVAEVILSFGDSSYGTLNPCWITFWFTDKIGFSETTYKNHLEIEKMLMELLMLHLQHTAGLTKFGGKDTDGDGIYDKDDVSSCWFKRIQRLS
jgi:hypothetical protein